MPDLAEQPNGDAQLASESAEMHQKPLLLDRAVAVINGKVILASEVREMQRFAVFEPLSALGGEFTPMEAMRQIMNRTLLLDQMQEQELTPPPSDAEVDDQIALLRKHIPACGQSCETEEGWQRFLKAQGLTEAEFRTRWQQRLAILDFVRVRFRTGIRITKPEIETYYKEQLVPEFAARKLKPPPLAQVSDRIEEVLLEQHVNVLLEDYLRSLKDAGSVLILDRQYNSLGSSPSSGTGGGDVPLHRAMEANSEHHSTFAASSFATATKRVGSRGARCAVLLPRCHPAGGNCVLVRDYCVVRRSCAGETDRRADDGDRWPRGAG